MTRPAAAPAARPPRPLGRLALRTVAIAYLLGLVVLPVGAVFRATFAAGPAEAWHALASRAAVSALWLTLWTAAVVTLVNAVLGTITAWVLARYRFPGRAILNAVIDLPITIPTVVSGLMLLVLYGPSGLAGEWLEARGLRVLFTPWAVVLALLFVTFPFVVRAVAPVLQEIEADQEEAAFILGAWPVTTFRRVILPAIAPAVLTGSLLSFARALGEFGTVVIVAGNIPNRTLTAPVYVFGAIESGQPQAASAVSALLVTVSFSLILVVDRFGRRRRRLVGGR